MANYAMNTTVSLPYNDTDIVWKSLTIAFASSTGFLVLVLILVAYFCLQKTCNNKQVHTTELADHGEETSYSSREIRALKQKNKKYSDKLARYKNKISLTDENLQLKMAIQKLRQEHKDQKLRMNMAKRTTIGVINLYDNACKKPDVDETCLVDETGNKVNKTVGILINTKSLENTMLEDSCKSSSSVNAHERNYRYLINEQSEDMNIFDKKVTVERNNSGASQFVSVRAGSDDVITEEEECKHIKDDVQSEKEECKPIKSKKKRRPTLKGTFQDKIHLTST